MPFVDAVGMAEHGRDWSEEWAELRDWINETTTKRKNIAIKSGISLVMVNTGFVRLMSLVISILRGRARLSLHMRQAME